MAAKTLVEKIESLPESKRAQIEDFVDFLHSRSSPTVREVSGADPLLSEIEALRNRLFEEHGLFDTTEIRRDLRENRS